MYSGELCFSSLSFMSERTNDISLNAVRDVMSDHLFLYVFFWERKTEKNNWRGEQENWRRPTGQVANERLEKARTKKLRKREVDNIEKLQQIAG